MRVPTATTSPTENPKDISAMNASLWWICSKITRRSDPHLKSSVVTSSLAEDYERQDLLAISTWLVLVVLELTVRSNSLHQLPLIRVRNTRMAFNAWWRRCKPDERGTLVEAVQLMWRCQCMKTPGTAQPQLHAHTGIILTLSFNLEGGISATR
jgi:hypothetical protein